MMKLEHIPLIAVITLIPSLLILATWEEKQYDEPFRFTGEYATIADNTQKLMELAPHLDELIVIEEPTAKSKTVYVGNKKMIDVNPKFSTVIHVKTFLDGEKFESDKIKANVYFGHAKYFEVFVGSVHNYDVEEFISVNIPLYIEIINDSKYEIQGVISNYSMDKQYLDLNKDGKLSPTLLFDESQIFYTVQVYLTQEVIQYD